MTSKLISAIMSQMGRRGAYAQSLEAKRKGGRASMAALTPEQRVEKAKAARAVGVAKQAKRRGAAKEKRGAEENPS